MYVRRDWTLWISLMLLSLCIFSALKLLFPIGIFYEKAPSEEINYVGRHGEILESGYKGIKTTKKPNLEYEYIMVDEEYSFAGMENYKKIATYGNELIIATESFNLNSPFKMKRVLNEMNHDGKWANVGIKNVNLDKIEIVVPRHIQIISNTIQGLYGESYGINERKEYYVLNEAKPECPNIMFKSDLNTYSSYHEIETDIPKVMAKYDLYQRIDSETKIPELKNMEVLEEADFSYNALEYRQLSETSEVMVQIVLMIAFLVFGVSFFVAYIFKSYGHKRSNDY